MERHLDIELKKLNTNLLKMAALTEEAIHKSVLALKELDVKKAQELIRDDQIIDEMENEIEEHAIELSALFQPMANDLRFIMAAMRITTELERIADLTVNICQRALELAAQKKELIKPLIDIPKLGNNARNMVKHVIDAFVQHDLDLAQEVILSDKESNQLRTAIITELIDDYIVKDGTVAPRAVPLILVARDLERICDHATNIAEDVIYLIQAKVVKHHPERLKEQNGA